MMAQSDRETIATAAIPAVLKAFGLTVSDTSVLLAAGATPNISILVGTAPDRYVLRCCRRDSREERLRFLSEYHRHLSISGIPVAQLLTTKRGDDLIHVDQWWWQVYSFLDGTDYDYDNPQHLDDAAYWLGQVHQASSTFKPCQYTPYDCALEKWWTSPQTQLETAWRYFSDLSESTAEQFQRCQARDVFAFWAEKIGQWITTEKLLRLPYTWTHGDYHGGNLKFKGDQLLGLLDFDQADTRPRVYDLAFALLMMARRRRGLYELRPDAMSRFLAMYESVAPPLSPLERQAIPSMMIVSQLPDWGLLWALARCEGDASVANAITYWVKVLQEIAAQTVLLTL